MMILQAERSPVSMPWRPRRHPFPIALPERRPLPVEPWRPFNPTPIKRYPWQRILKPGRKKRELNRRPATAAELAGLDGLGRWLKKQVKSINRIAAKPLGLISKQLEKNVVKVTDKIADNVDSLHTSINKFAKRNTKWIVIAAAIVITIYSMGSGATLAAQMISGCQAIAAKVGAVFVSGAATGGASAGTIAATGATTAATSAVAATAGTTLATTAATAGLGSTFWSSVAPLALSVGSKLVGGAKCSDLSPEERLAYGEAAEAGLMPMNAELSRGLGLGDSSKVGETMGGGGGSPSGGSAFSSMPSWVIPAAIGAAALVLVVAMKK